MWLHCFFEFCDLWTKVADWFSNITCIHENVANFWLDQMIEKGLCQVFDIKNCDENSFLVHVILNGGSTTFFLNKFHLLNELCGTCTFPLVFSLWPIMFFSQLHHPDNLIWLVHLSFGTGNTYVAKYIQQIHIPSQLVSHNFFAWGHLAFKFHTINIYPLFFQGEERSIGLWEFI